MFVNNNNNNKNNKQQIAGFGFTSPPTSNQSFLVLKSASPFPSLSKLISHIFFFFTKHQNQQQSTVSMAAVLRTMHICNRHLLHFCCKIKRIHKHENKKTFQRFYNQRNANRSLHKQLTETDSKQLSPLFLNSIFPIIKWLNVMLTNVSRFFLLMPPISGQKWSLDQPYTALTYYS